MKNFKAASNRIDRLLAAARARLPKFRRLPFVVVDFQSDTDMPGWEEHNQAAREQAKESRMAVKAYGFDPDELFSEE